MKVRHAVALALVGWYLMMPPPPPPGDHTTPQETPLYLWRTYSSFDNAKDCEEARSKMVNKPPTPSAAEGEALYLNIRCIASDDPRLKPK
jgi:hypothetical protein